MKKFFFTISLNIIFLSITLSQVYNPLIKENVYWDALRANSQNLYLYDGGYRFFFEGDTIISNHTYKILKYHPIINVIPSLSQLEVDTSQKIIHAFFREDLLARKVFIKEPFLSQEELFFDFTLNVGDSLNCPPQMMGGSQIIDAISYIQLLNGQIRKVWHIENGNQFIIEGVGTSQGFFFPAVTGFGFWYEENCFYDDSTHLYGNQCFPIMTSVKYISKSKIKLYPNPTDEFLYIQREEDLHELLLIYDTLGNEILSKNLYSKNEEINLAHLSSGIYYYKINSRKSGKIIKE